MRDHFAFILKNTISTRMYVACVSVITCATNYIMEQAMVKEITLTRSLAPDDIVKGIYVMTLHRQYQLLMSKCSPLGDPEVVIVPVVLRPYDTDLPMRVVSVCLPYVVVENEKGKTEILDTRSHRVARVPKRFAQSALKPHIEKKGTPKCKCKKCKAKQR